MKKALIVIDIQNDYFEGGKFPLWNTEATISNIEKAISSANNKDIPVILVQHVMDGDPDTQALVKGTEGAKIHDRILDIAPNAQIVTKAYADGFYRTNLEDVLSKLNAEELLVCGMMTQNCVTHTAISKSAEKYNVKILQDCSTTVNEAIHYIALEAVSTRLELVNSMDVLS